MHNPFAYMGASEMLQRIRSREVSALEVVEFTLDYAEEANSLLNCFSAIDREGAVRSAKGIDKRLFSGERVGLLAGLPVSVKDLIPVRGLSLTYGSRIYADHVAEQDAVAVERLRREGACIVGMTTTSEFGAKGVGDNPLNGTTRNPWNVDYTPGGSSAGAAASVAAGVTPVALGTDGGGSLRIPAALCGLAGVKAQFGRVPVVPATGSPTLSHVGPIARRLEDAGLVLSVVAGYDDRDPGSVREGMPDVREALRSGVAGLRIGYSRDFGYATPDQDVLDSVEDSVSVLRSQGADVSIIDESIEDPFELWRTEFYTGIATRQRRHLDESAGEFDPIVYQEMIGARRHSAIEYQEVLFKRHAFRQRIWSLFSTFDVLVCPSVPTSRLPVGRSVPTGYPSLPVLKWSSYTYPFNLTGHPALSVPCGFDGAGMPIGVQVISQSYREDFLFRVGGVLERHYRFFEKTPDLFRAIPGTE